MERSTNLQGRALDAAVAERVMGWTDVGSGNFDRENLYGLSPGFSSRTLIPHYSTDWHGSYLLRAEIERRGLVDSFVNAAAESVLDGTDAPMSASFSARWFWATLNLSPAAQCRAALKAVEGAHV